MKHYGRSIFGAVALFVMASSLVRAADPEWLAPDPQVETSPVAPRACDAVPSSAGTALSVLVPNLTPGFEFSASLLFLKPGADNPGYATITTFLPVGSPQWAVQELDPRYQPGFNVGARYTFSSSGNDIQINWDHLHTSDSASATVNDPATQWVSPFSQTGPATSESANEVGVFHLKATQAQVHFDYDMVNIDVGQTVNIGSNSQLRLFAGLSCVRLREQLISTF